MTETQTDYPTPLQCAPAAKVALSAAINGQEMSGTPRNNRAPIPPKPAPLARKSVEVAARTPEEGARQTAEAVASPELAAVRLINAIESPGIAAQLDLPTLLDVLRKQSDTINKGNIALGEAMLINQAVALQSLFARLVERGMSADLLDPYEVHMRLALRAQAQCTRTLEVLAAIKNPPVVIAKQANIAHQQQVNNNAAPPARETENSPNKLLETLPDERLEFGTPATASGADPHLETVGAIHRAEVGNR